MNQQNKMEFVIAVYNEIMTSYNFKFICTKTLTIYIKIILAILVFQCQIKSYYNTWFNLMLKKLFNWKTSMIKNKYILSIINHSLLGNKTSSQMLLMFKVIHIFLSTEVTIWMLANAWSTAND